MKKRVFSSLLAVVLMTLVFVLPILNAKLTYRETAPSQTIDKVSRTIVDKKDKTDKPQTADEQETDQDVTYLVTLQGDSLLDTVIASRGKYAGVKELLLSADAKQYVDVLKKNQAVVKASIQKLVSGSDFSGCQTFLAVLNGFTVKAPSRSEEKLQGINGVNTVTVLSERDYFFTAEDEVNDQAANTATAPSVDLEKAAYPSRLSAAPKRVIHAQEAYDNGLSGSGVLIAVLDTEFNTRHEAFSAQPEVASLTKEELSALYRKVYFNTGSLTEKNVPYLSRKIVFAYDYADSKTNTENPSLDHGTAVAAAAAGNNGKSGEEAYTGVAYDAQLALMKVSSGKDSDGHCFSEPALVLAALDDSVKLGADVICMSFGKYRESSNAEIYQPVLSGLQKAGINVVCPSGNGSYNGASFGVELHTSDIDYGTGNYLSGLEGVLTVGAVNNRAVTTRYFMTGDKEIPYRDLCAVRLDMLPAEQQRIPYICLDADGNLEDYYHEDTTGKLVMINQSELSADRVYEIAADHGAAALAVIADTEKTDYGLEAVSPSIPMLLLQGEWAAFFHDNPNGEIAVIPYGVYTEKQDPISIASYTSYDALTGLQLSERVLACGEAIYAPSANGSSAAYDGSSMACGEGAGVCALLSQHSDQNNNPVTKLPQTTRALLMSTAELIEYGKNTSEETLYLSPRQQGAGVIRTDRATAASAYLTNEKGEPFAESLGDGISGEYHFSFTLHNLSQEEQTYTPSVSLQTDRYKSDGSNGLVNTLKPYSLNKLANIRFLRDGKRITSVTVGKGESVTLEAVMTLDPYEAERLLQSFTNGYYLDGFLFLRDQNGNSLHGVFVGFYGDLSSISPFDSTVYDGHDSVSGLDSSFCAAAENNGETAAAVLLSRDGALVFSSNAVAAATENSGYGSSRMLPNLYLLRDAYDVTVSVLNQQGSSLFSCRLGKVSAYRDSRHEPYEALTAHQAEMERFFAGLNDGSYRYRISCRVMGANRQLSEEFVQEIPFIADSVKPASLKNRTYLENGRIILELTAKDASGIADFVLYATAYNGKEKDYRYADRLSELVAAGFIAENCYTLLDQKSMENGTAIFRYDITNLSAELNKLQLHTSSWSNKSSTLKIAYKAIDAAYNESDARTADTIVYGSAEFSFTDQNGKTAPGMSVVLDGRKLSADKNGMIQFDHLKPDYYLAYLVYDESCYTPEHTRFLIHISNDGLQFKAKETVEFLGEYPPEELASQNSLSSADQQQEEASQDAPAENAVNTDNPAFAILFVCFLLAIGGITIISRLKLRADR